MNLTMAYGRDAKSIKAVKEMLQAGKDFIIADITHPYCGKPVNAEQLRGEGLKEVYIRYAGNRKVAKLAL